MGRGKEVEKYFILRLQEENKLSDRDRSYQRTVQENDGKRS
jgi:hypothetical protein